MLRLMAEGTIKLDDLAEPVKIERGRIVRTSDDQELGRVAALLVDGSGETRGLLLSRLPGMAGYYLMPVDFVAGIEPGRVRVRLLSTEGDLLPAWRGHFDSIG
jgi:hypothetical protein